VVDAQYNVVVIRFGAAIEGPGEASTRLAKRFGIPAEAADKLVASLPALVKRGVARGDAEKLATVLRSDGFEVRVVAQRQEEVTRDVQAAGFSESSPQEPRSNDMSTTPSTTPVTALTSEASQAFAASPSESLSTDPPEFANPPSDLGPASHNMFVREVDTLDALGVAGSQSEAGDSVDAAVTADAEQEGAFGTLTGQRFSLMEELAMLDDEPPGRGFPHFPQKTSAGVAPEGTSDSEVAWDWSVSDDSAASSEGTTGEARVGEARPRVPEGAGTLSAIGRSGSLEAEIAEMSGLYAVEDLRRSEGRDAEDKAYAAPLSARPARDDAAPSEGEATTAHVRPAKRVVDQQRWVAKLAPRRSTQVLWVVLFVSILGAIAYTAWDAVRYSGMDAPIQPDEMTEYYRFVRQVDDRLLHYGCGRRGNGRYSCDYEGVFFSTLFPDLGASDARLIAAGCRGRAADNGTRFEHRLQCAADLGDGPRSTTVSFVESRICSASLAEVAEIEPVACTYSVEAELGNATQSPSELARFVWSEDATYQFERVNPSVTTSAGTIAGREFRVEGTPVARRRAYWSVEAELMLRDGSAGARPLLDIVEWRRDDGTAEADEAE